MKNNLDLGEEYVELTINGDENRVIRIDLNDIGIVERMNEANKKIDEFQNSLKDMAREFAAQDDEVAQNAEILKAFRNVVEEQIDYILNANVSSVVFGGKNPLSTVKGVPLYERFFDALIPYINKIAIKEAKEKEKRISKYTKVIK